jgi:hypothetical protein
MWKKTFLILMSFILFHTIPVSSHHTIHNSLSFKVSIVTKESQIEWVYQYPNEFRKRIDGKDIIGTKAEQEMLALFQDLDLHETARADDMVKILRKKGFDSIQRLEVVWKSRGIPLRTWVWEEKQ